MTRRPRKGLAGIAGIVAVVAALVAWPTAGLAEPVAHRLGYAVDVPETWTFDVERSNAVSRGLQAERHYDGLRTDVGADAYAGARASLFVQWIHARDKVENAARLELTMRRTFDQIRAAASAGELVAWREDVRPDLAEGNLEWKDPAGGTVTLVRAFVFVTDDDLLRQVRAECVYSVAAPADRDRCKRALASLELTEATGPRGSIGAVPGAGSLRMSNDSDAEPEIAVEPGDAPPDDSDDEPVDANGDKTEQPGGETSDRLVLEAPSLDQAAGASAGDGAPRVLYQAPNPSDEPRPTDRTDQLITLIGAVLVAAAVYAMWRERRRKASGNLPAPDSGTAPASESPPESNRPT